MSFEPLGQGIVATAIALLMLACWIAIGTVFMNRDEGDSVALSTAILIGSGLTSFFLAIFAAVGLVGTGVLVVSGIAIVVLLVRRRQCARVVVASLSSLSLYATNAILKVSAIALTTVLWLSAIAPPRSADAMRYHLAHIRQIAEEGKWVPIADYHYALPFGWSLSYLPFELLGIPQGAQLLNALLLIVLVATIVRELKVREVGNRTIILVSLMFWHPAVIRVFSEANADGYALLAMMTIAILLARAPMLSNRDALVLGFVSWIGMQSRYQLVAAGMAGLMVLLIAIRREPQRFSNLLLYVPGAVAALALASPFYISNYRAFGNPVWPLMISASAAGSSYADGVAREFSDSLTGDFAPLHVAEAFWSLVSTAYLLPLAILILVTIAVALRTRNQQAAVVARFGAAFFSLWFLMAPLLYPRFVLLLLPVAALCTGLFLNSRHVMASAPERRFSRALGSVAVVLALISVAVFADNLRFAATGDSDEYHRYTWFYTVYDWMNRSIPQDARVLVILSSGHTYYLQRPYRRADPWLSGVVDWQAISSSKALDTYLDKERYSYVIYENRDWHWFRGGESMKNAIRESLQDGSLVPVHRFEERLYRSRVRRRYTEANVYVLAHEIGR